MIGGGNGMIIRLGTMFFGVLLIAGEMLFPNFTMMWFASPDTAYAVWRELLVLGLVAHIVVREYYDNAYLHALWTVVAFALTAGGVDYFINNPSYIFDALFMVGIGVTFAIDALQRIPVESADEEFSDRPVRNIVLAFLKMRWSIITFSNPGLLHQTVIQDDSHILFIR